MKKGFKIAGAIAGLAALAALVPYSVSKDDDDTTTVRALLWEYTKQPDPESPGSHKVSIDIGFHNPFDQNNDDLLMDDEDDLLLIDAPEVVDEPAVDIGLTLEPNPDDVPVEAPEVEQF